jgi:N utilization substance protein B
MSTYKINTKTIARIAAVQTLYQYQNSIGETDIQTVLLRMNEFYKDPNLKNDHDLQDSKLKLRPSYKYLEELVNFTHQNLEEIDIIIKEHLSKDWQISDLSVLLLSVLRVAICEIKYFPETPFKVIINEYTDISGDMLGENEIGFVNSLLHNYALKNR